MYSPRYTITNKILINIGQIEGGREVIENAPLVPSFEKEFQTDAIVRTVYHGTHIEGNDLTLSQTKRVLEGSEVFGRPRDVQEVINFRNVITLLEELKHKRGEYIASDLLDIHRITVARIIPIEKIGVFRTSEVVIREEGTGKVIFTPPSFVQVPFLIDGFFEWFNSEVSHTIHPVLRAAIAHYVLVSIHPFVEGNGRTVRAFTTLVLIREGYDIKNFFSIEEHFDNDLEAYYDAFSKVDSQSVDISMRDLTAWIEYFTEVMAIEVTKIKERVRKLSIDTKFKVKLGEQIALSERQMRIVEYLTDTGSGVMKDLKRVLPMVSEDTILRDMKVLMQNGIIKKEGATKASRYVVSQRA